MVLQVEICRACSHKNKRVLVFSVLLFLANVIYQPTVKATASIAGEAAATIDIPPQPVLGVCLQHTTTIVFSAPVLVLPLINN